VAKKKPYRFFLYLLARAGAGFVFLMPRVWALAIARAVGSLAYDRVPRQRKKILANLRQAYGSTKSPEEIESLGRKVMVHAAQAAVEWIQLPKWDLKKIERFVDLGDVMTRYESLQREGKGIIAVTGHIGNWELLAAALCLKGLPLTVIARKIYYEPYNRWIVNIRKSVNVRMVYRDGSARELLSCLKRNEIIGVLPDQDVDSLPGIFVDFFGHPAYTPVAPVKLALKTGAPIVVTALVRQPAGRYRFLVAGVIRPVLETTAQEAIQKYTELWMRSLESIIRQYPEQWVWMHSRWKTKDENRTGPRKETLKTS